jgi:hypothetical protein
MYLTGDDTVVAVARSTETEEDDVPLEPEETTVADADAEDLGEGEELV